MAQKEIKISILIPTLQKRVDSFTSLLNNIERQRKGRNEIHVCWLSDNGEMSIGEKRNKLLEAAKGEYLCFIDDDDDISDEYIDTLLTAIETKPDCVSLVGIITWDGERPEYFEHSIKYDRYETTNGVIKYLRYPNHLNCIKSDIAKRFKFKGINHGEDTDWATQIHNSGLLKSECYTDKILYYYNYITNK